MDNTCCFTGHRTIPPENLEKIRKKTRSEIKRLIGAGVKNFICGGAVGFDALAADEVIKLKRKYPEIKFLLALPCQNQDRFFTPEQKKAYRSHIEAADKYIYVSENYSADCMHKRNRFMVDKSAYLIAYCTKESGGSYYTVSYAQKKGIEIINITP